jgi:SPP1 gp7 family putative phage head morphogenesis protein
MDKYNKEIEQTLLNNEKTMLKQLETTYVKALADVKGRLRLLQAREETQSTIYQINYQKSLESQINAILGLLKQDNITNVQDFLNHMYEDGYLGVQYSLMKQGVPVITAINQEEVAKSLFKQLGHMTFADRLNVNMNDFKVKIKDTITRGLASASTYKDIAAQLSLVTNEELYKSYRIARTEGHRITTEAKLTSMKKAKQQGADVVKQWDATLDGKTRKNHRKLDGQWVEIDDYFEINGRKVKAPAKFGKASEDINCRCILLTRPRWAVDKTRVKSAKIKDEYGKEDERLIEVKNYEDYKKGYYKLIEDDPNIEKKVKEANKKMKGGN